MNCQEIEKKKTTDKRRKKIVVKIGDVGRRILLNIYDDLIGSRSSPYPLLFILHKEKQTLHNLWKNESNTVTEREFGNKRIAAFGYGWWVVVHDDDDDADMAVQRNCFLVNLASLDKRIQLPNLFFSYKSCAISSSPTGNSYILFTKEDDCSTLKFCQPGDYKFLNMKFTMDGKPVEVEHLFTSGGKIYGITRETNLLVRFKLYGGERLHMTYLLLSDVVIPRHDSILTNTCSRYFFKFGADLYMVQKIHRGMTRDVEDFIIYKSSFSTTEMEWVKVPNIGSYAIFLNATGDAIICRSTMKNQIRRNSIYYFEKEDAIIYGWNLNLKRIFHHQPCSVLENSETYQFYWIMWSKK